MEAEFFQYDEDKLFEDINFPLVLQYEELYDNAGNLVIRNINEELAKKLVGRYREIEQFGNDYNNDYNANILDKKTGVIVAVIEGWSRMVGKDSPTDRMVNITNYLTNRLNAI